MLRRGLRKALTLAWEGMTGCTTAVLVTSVRFNLCSRLVDLMLTPSMYGERSLADKLYVRSQHSIRIYGASLILRNVWCNCMGARDLLIS